MTVTRLTPNPQKVSDAFLRAVEERFDDARSGEITSMLVVSHMRDGTIVMDRSVELKNMAVLLGLLDTIKHELLMQQYESGGPGTRIDEG